MQKQCFPNDGKKLELDFGRPLPRLGPPPFAHTGENEQEEEMGTKEEGDSCPSLSGWDGRSGGRRVG